MNSPSCANTSSAAHLIAPGETLTDGLVSLGGPTPLLTAHFLGILYWSVHDHVDQVMRGAFEISSTHVRFGLTSSAVTKLASVDLDPKVLKTHFAGNALSYLAAIVKAANNEEAGLAWAAGGKPGPKPKPKEPRSTGPSSKKKQKPRGSAEADTEWVPRD